MFDKYAAKKEEKSHKMDVKIYFTFIFLNKLADKN